MTESPMQSKEQRVKICEMVFEKLNVLNYYTCKNAVLSW